MEITIRNAALSDVPSLSSLLRSIGTFRQINTESHEATLFRVESHLKMCLSDESHLVLIAEDDSQALKGYVSVHWLPYLFLAGPEGYVSELFVSADARGNGIGGQLLDAVVRSAKARGSARLMLVNIKDRESYKRRFYSKHAWEERQDVAQLRALSLTENERNRHRAERQTARNNISLEQPPKCVGGMLSAGVRFAPMIRRRN